MLRNVDHIMFGFTVYWGGVEGYKNKVCKLLNYPKNSRKCFEKLWTNFCFVFLPREFYDVYDQYTILGRIPHT